MAESLVEFLRARLNESAAWLSAHRLDYDDCQECGFSDFGHSPYSSRRLLAEVEAKRRIIDWHENWPVLIERPQQIEEADPADLNSMTLRMSRQIAWLTEQEYRNRFGSEPPTSPILRMLAQPYFDHEAFQPEWKL